MDDIIRIGLTVILAVAFLAPAAVGQSAGSPNDRRRQLRQTESHQLVQKDQKTANAPNVPGKQPDETLAEDVDSEPKPSQDGEEGVSQPKEKPLVPFVPSERIPAEQAVDFPTDI